jgi:hypothetical protein
MLCTLMFRILAFLWSPTVVTLNDLFWCIRMRPTTADKSLLPPPHPLLHRSLSAQSFITWSLMFSWFLRLFYIFITGFSKVLRNKLAFCIENESSMFLMVHYLTSDIHHPVFCLTTVSKPPPKWFLHIVRSRASSFKWEYPLLFLRSSASWRS